MKMATVEDLKADLESYVTSVADIETENSELKRRVQFLENDRENEAKIWMEKLKEGKESWREQALQHGRNQKQRTILECEKVMQAFQSEMRTQQFTNQSKDNSLLLSSLLRAENSFEIAEHQRRVYEAMAFTGATKATVTLQDYDIEDNHISLFNRTHLEVSLIGCLLKFKISGARYKFPDDTIIMPNSTLSLWFGKDAHSTIRHSKAAGSLYWNSNAAITNDFSSSVNLVDKNGSVFAFVPANKARYPFSERQPGEGHANLDQNQNGHASLVGKHDHFLRFDHFLRLKNDAFGEPILGHQDPSPLAMPIALKREHAADLESGATTTSSSSSSSCSSSSFSHSHTEEKTPSRKKPCNSLSHHNSASSVESCNTGGRVGASDNVDPTASNVSIVPASQSTSTSYCSDQHANPLSVWNVRAMTLSLRPYLHSRNQGCLSLHRAIRRAGTGCAVSVSVLNRGDRPVDLAGWRLFAMGNPSQELFLPEECHIGPLSEIALVSGLDEETLLWAQVASSAPANCAHTAAGVNGSASGGGRGHGDVTPDSQTAGRRRSVGLFEEVNTLRHEERVPSSGSTVIEADRDSADTETPPQSSSLSLSLSRVSPHIFEIAGLSALSRGDVLSLHLVDSKGRNVCMLGSDGWGHVHVHGSEEAKGHTQGLGQGHGHGQHTVFGDRAVEAEHKPTSTSISPFGMASDSRSPVAGCSIQ